MNENKTSRVAFERRAVWIDGVETRILAGTMHYFRQPREYWRERMEKAAEMKAQANTGPHFTEWNRHISPSGIAIFHRTEPLHFTEWVDDFVRK